MSVFDTFSKRMKKQANAGKADVFRYDGLSKQFRTQVVHIWTDAIGELRTLNWTDPGAEIWPMIVRTMCKELGLFRLTDDGDYHLQCSHFLLECTDESALDIIELTFVMIDTAMRNHWTKYAKHDCRVPQQSPDDAIDELNLRFLEHSLGYEFAAGRLIRKDSQFVHAEVVRPAITLLDGTEFSGASEEFLKAHEHYRHGRNKEAIVGALNAFESTMKTICQGRAWEHKPSDTSKHLISILVTNELIPAYLTSHFSALANTLEAGLPTVRNKSTAAHGQGSQPIAIPAYLASYALHLAATNILLLVEAHKAMQ